MLVLCIYPKNYLVVVVLLVVVVMIIMIVIMMNDSIIVDMYVCKCVCIYVFTQVRVISIPYLYLYLYPSLSLSLFLSLLTYQAFLYQLPFLILPPRPARAYACIYVYSMYIYKLIEGFSSLSCSASKKKKETSKSFASLQRLPSLPPPSLYNSLLYI